MSTLADHARRRRERRWRNARTAQRYARHAYNVVRPPLMAGLGYGGWWIFAEELRASELHHNTVVWILGLFLMGAAAASLWRDVRDRVRFRRWERTADPGHVRHGSGDAHELLRRLPPWFGARYRAKMREVD